MLDRNPQAGLGTAEHARNTVDAVYRSDSRHVLATLIRLLGDFDIAEEALHDAFRTALEQWPRDGLTISSRRYHELSSEQSEADHSLRIRTSLGSGKLETLPDA